MKEVIKLALRAGYKGIKKFIADKLNSLGDVDNLATDAEVASAVSNRVTYADNGVLGAKNLNFTLYSPLNTPRGITWVKNEDGTITASGTNDGTGNSNFGGGTYDTFTAPISGNIKYSGAVDENNTVYLYDRTADILYDELTSPSQIGSAVFVKGHNYQLACRNKKDAPAIATPITFKPMIWLASDTDANFQSPAQTNRELTVGKTDTTVIGNTEDGATASQAYAVGQGFIRDGQFRVAKGDGVASGGQITDSNSEVKPIADFICPVRKTAIAATGISLVANRNKIIKIGHVVWLSIRFTITEALEAGSHNLFTLPDKSYEVSNLLMNNASVPYNLELPLAYLLAGGNIVYVNRELPAGTYDVFGMYICE